MIDKKIKYAIQGKVKNYLGKQKMVKAPKYWKSGPDHPDTELAYITKAEKDLLIKKDLHKSLKGGVNRGPSGIISLNGWGDKGDFGGSSGGGSGGNGSTNRERGIQQSYSAPAPAPAPAPAKDEDRPTSFTPAHWDDLTKTTPVEDAREKAISEQYTDKGITHEGGDAKVMEDFYNKTNLKKTEKEKEEDWEKKQDWDLIKDLSKKGYDFDEIQDAVEKGLTQKAPTDRRQSLIDSGLRSIIPETSLEKSLLSRAKSFMPDTKTGIMSTVGNYFNPGKMFTNFALNKMGLGFLNPIMGLASLFGFKNQLANIGTKYAGVPYKEGPTIKDNQQQIPENVMQASIQKFQPTQSQVMQMAEIQRKRDILQSYADKKGLNEKGMNTLAQMNQMIGQYQANPRSIYG